MSETRILIPWDELTEEQRGKVSTDIWFSVYYENVMKHCTTPLRPPDEWTKDDISECVSYLSWWAINKNDTQKTAKAIIEIATRPPKRSAVEEMDLDMEHICAILHSHEDHELGDTIKTHWQAVKKELLP